MKIEIRKDGNEIYGIIYGSKKEEILANEEQIRTTALQEASTDKEKQVILESELDVFPRVLGGFYVEFKGFK